MPDILPFLLKKPMEQGEIVNPILEARAAKGGYLESLSWTDRQRLRAVVKKVHMKHHPTEMITDREADKMIEAIAPETARYLIERNWDQVK